MLFTIPGVYFALLLVGAVRAYTHVPTFDMWEGGLLTGFRILDGDWREIFRFWNEHCMVFSRVLFYLDMRFFGARLIFLTIANIALVIGLWLALCAAAAQLIADRNLRRIVCCGVAALSFSWLQRENIYSPFQSQFLLAYLVPLAAFLALARSVRKPESQSWFVAALLLGAASLGTMANGLLVFPLLITMQAALGGTSGRVSWMRLGLLAVCGAPLTALWFQGFPGAPADMPAPGDLIIFVATFLAFPLAEPAGVAGGIAGTAILFVGLFFVLRYAWRARATLDPTFVALLTLIAYVGATSLMTAYGRASEIANAALVGRYATGSLLGWAALAILLAATLQSRPNARRIFASTGVIVALALLPVQLVRTTGDRGPEFVQGSMRAALALELGVPDLTALGWVFPAPAPAHFGLLKSIADRLAARDLSVFADPTWDRVIAKLGMPDATGFHACNGTVELVSDIPGESRFAAAQGWFVDDTAARPPRFVYFADGGEIIGLAVGGGVRPDVADSVGPKGRYSGFAGYVLATNSEVFTVLCPDGEF